MTTSAAGLRLGAVVRLRLTALASDRRLIRVHQGKGRQDRAPFLSARRLAELRADWTLYRPASGLLPGHDTPQPLPSATAQQLYYRAQRAAGLSPGTGMHTLRHCLATPLLAAGVARRTLHLLRGHRSIETTTRSRHITRQPLAQGHSPFALLSFGDLPGPQPE